MDRTAAFAAAPGLPGSGNLLLLTDGRDRRAAGQGKLV
jgi:hypothetical protein